MCRSQAFFIRFLVLLLIETLSLYKSFSGNRGFYASCRGTCAQRSVHPATDKNMAALMYHVRTEAKALQARPKHPCRSMPEGRCMAVPICARWALWGIAFEPYRITPGSIRNPGAKGLSGRPYTIRSGTRLTDATKILTLYYPWGI